MAKRNSGKRRYTRMPPTSTPPVGNFVKRQILSGNESECYRLLMESAGDDYQVFPKVALKDIIRATHRADFSRIQSKHVDFIIAGSNGRSTVAAIELDDKSHDELNNILHDAVKDFYLNRAGIPIIRFRKSDLQSLSPVDLRNVYLTAKAKDNCTYPQIKTKGKGCATAFLPLIAIALWHLFKTL